MAPGPPLCREEAAAFRPPGQRKPERCLLSDAEARKNHPEQVVGGELAGDLVDGLLGEAEFLGHQLEGVAGFEGGVDAGVGFAQGDEVAFAGEDHVFAVAVPAGDAQKLGAQQLDALAGLGRQVDAHRAVDVDALGLAGLQVDLVEDGDALDPGGQAGVDGRVGIGEPVAHVHQAHDHVGAFDLLPGAGDGKLRVDRILPAELPEGKGTVDYIYEQPPAQLLGTLLPRYVEVALFQAMLESAASEHAARMTAMEAATKNAGEMIDKLTLYMNRVRQASITKEIIEVVSGAAASE